MGWALNSQQGRIGRSSRPPPRHLGAHRSPHLASFEQLLVALVTCLLRVPLSAALPRQRVDPVQQMTPARSGWLLQGAALVLLLLSCVQATDQSPNVTCGPIASDQPPPPAAARPVLNLWAAGEWRYFCGCSCLPKEPGGCSARGPSPGPFGPCQDNLPGWRSQYELVSCCGTAPHTWNTLLWWPEEADRSNMCIPNSAWVEPSQPCSARTYATLQLFRASAALIHASIHIQAELHNSAADDGQLGRRRGLIRQPHWLRLAGAGFMDVSVRRGWAQAACSPMW